MTAKITKAKKHSCEAGNCHLCREDAKWSKAVMVTKADYKNAERLRIKLSLNFDIFKVEASEPIAQALAERTEECAKIVDIAIEEAERGIRTCGKNCDEKHVEAWRERLRCLEGLAAAIRKGKP